METRFTEETGIEYKRLGKNHFRHIDTNDGRSTQVGPIYHSKAELLADHERYLKDSWGLEGSVGRKVMKIKTRDTYIFGEGMQQGAIDFALGVDNAIKASRPDATWRQYDYIAFGGGYKLGNGEKYHGAWEMGKNLLFTAVEYGDIEPVDWKIGYGIDGNYIDEV